MFISVFYFFRLLFLIPSLSLSLSSALFSSKNQIKSGPISKLNIIARAYTMEENDVDGMYSISKCLLTYLSPIQCMILSKKQLLWALSNICCFNFYIISGCISNIYIICMFCCCASQWQWKKIRKCYARTTSSHRTKTRRKTHPIVFFIQMLISIRKYPLSMYLRLKDE